MGKRWFLVGMIFLLVAWLLVGCGVPQEKYDVTVSDLDKAQEELRSVKAELEATQTKLAGLEATVSSLQGKSTESETTVATLQADLKTANAEVAKLGADVKAQQNISSALTTELKKVKDPRHFSTLAELTDWLHQDDTNTKYATESATQKSFILQVRALRNGYLLPVRFYVQDGKSYVDNTAVIGDYIFVVSATTDLIVRWQAITPIPSHPLPLE